MENVPIPACPLVCYCTENEPPYQAFRGSGNLRAFQAQLAELARQHRQWSVDLDGFKDSLRAQGAEAKTLAYLNEAFGRLVERIQQLAG